MNADRWLRYCADKTTEELWVGLLRLDHREAKSLSVVLAHLGELDARRAAEPKGYPSLFAFCTRQLGYSEGEAWFRIRAARAARDFPRIFTMLERREITVSAVARLWPHLTPENYRSLLGKASRRTTAEIDRLVASLSPRQERRPVIRALSTGSDAVPAALAPVHEESLLAWKPAEETPTTAGTASQDASVAPVGGASLTGFTPANGSGATGSATAPEGRVHFSFAAPESLRRKFIRARGLLSHKYPFGLPEEVFDDALEALLDRKDPDRWIARRIARRLERRRRRQARRAEEERAARAGAREGSTAAAGARSEPIERRHDLIGYRLE